VGEFFAKHCRVVKIDKNVLFVGVENSVIMQELILIRDQLKDKIDRTLFIHLKEIVFFITEGYTHKDCTKT